MVERPVQHPLQPDVPAHSLNREGPGEAARREARTGLYVHVPFCAVRCHYCHFSTAAFSGDAVERWFAGIEREAALRAPLADGVAFTSLFFGGGTPSALSSRHFRRLWDLLRAHFTLAPGAEVTLEANPESAKAPLLAAWHEAGVNRLSFGAQSFEPSELRSLGRIHDEARPVEAVALAREHGFERVSLDLMYGYPGHTAESFARTLDRVGSLALEHVSAYCYIPEGVTPQGERALARGGPAVPDEAQAALYEQLSAAMDGMGLASYETSNFCRPDAESRHNLTYWLRRDYLALGPSAHGCWRGERWGNRFATADWAAALERGESPESERERSPEASISEEIVMLGLRLSSGLFAADYLPVEWEGVERRFGEAFAAARDAGRLEAVPGGWRIPRAHRFLADDTIAWLAARARG